MTRPSDEQSPIFPTEDGSLSDFDHPDLEALEERDYLPPGHVDDVLDPKVVKREAEAGHAMAPIADPGSISREPILARFKRHLADQKERGAK